VYATDENFALDSSDIPPQMRVPQSVRGIKFWPTPDAWLKAVRERGQQRNYFTNNFSDAYSLDFPSSSVVVCTVECVDFQLVGGTIKLGEDGCMVLNGRGENDMDSHEQKISDTTFEGKHDFS
jgi:hypothetical protein